MKPAKRDLISDEVVELLISKGITAEQGLEVVAYTIAVGAKAYKDVVNKTANGLEYEFDGLGTTVVTLEEE